MDILGGQNELQMMPPAPPTPPHPTPLPPHWLLRGSAGVHAQHHDGRTKVAGRVSSAVLQGRRPKQDDETKENAEN